MSRLFFLKVASHNACFLFALLPQMTGYADQPLEPATPISHSNRLRRSATQTGFADQPLKPATPISHSNRLRRSATRTGYADQPLKPATPISQPAG